MPRLFVPGERWRGDRVTLRGDEHHYVCRVLRLREGDRLTLFDGAGGEGEGRLLRPGAHTVDVAIGARRSIPVTPAPELILLLGLPKGERMDLVVQKATELGVARVVPVLAARSIPRLDAERARRRQARWTTIAREAARQCGRADAPIVDPVTPLAAALEAAPRAALKLLCWEEARGAALRDALPAQPAACIVVAVGPEGGFTAVEVEAARAAGFAVVSLGPRILRAETAAIAVLAVLGFALGDLGGG